MKEEKNKKINEENKKLFNELNNTIDDKEKIKIRNLIAEKNMTLVIHLVSKKYKGNNMDDLIQDGYCKLVEIIEKYNVDNGSEFSTFAYISIKRYLDVKNNKLKSSMSTSTDFSIKLFHLKKTYQEYISKNDINPTVEELAKLTGMSLEKTKEIYMYFDKVDGNAISLSQPFSTDRYENLNLIEIIKSTNVSIEEEICSKVNYEQMWNRILNMKMSERNLEIIKLSYGYKCREHSIDEIRKKYDISGERVRQIKEVFLEKANKQLKTFSEKNNLEIIGKNVESTKTIENDDEIELDELTIDFNLISTIFNQDENELNKTEIIKYYISNNNYDGIVFENIIDTHGIIKVVFRKLLYKAMIDYKINIEKNINDILISLFEISKEIDSRKRKSSSDEFTKNIVIKANESFKSNKEIYGSLETDILRVLKTSDNITKKIIEDTIYSEQIEKETLYEVAKKNNVTELEVIKILIDALHKYKVQVLYNVDNEINYIENYSRVKVK